MAYKTRPYGKFLIPSLTTIFEIAHGEISTYKLKGLAMRKVGSQPINDTTTVMDVNSNALGYGDARVTTNGAEQEYKNLRNVPVFVNSVLRERQSIKEAADKSEWNKEFTHDDLSDQALILPLVDNLPFQVRLALNGSFPDGYVFTKRFFSDNDWVKKGDKIASLRDINVTMPVSGRILFYNTQVGTSYGGRWDETTNWPKSFESEPSFAARLFNSSFALIQPLKGQRNTDTYIQEAYGDYIAFTKETLSRLKNLSDRKAGSRLSDFRFESKALSPSDTKNRLVRELSIVLQTIEAAKPHTIRALPFEEYPSAPSETWIDENAAHAGVIYSPRRESFQRPGFD